MGTRTMEDSTYTASHLSDLQDEDTDEFGRQIYQNARDQRRLRALQDQQASDHGRPPIAFRKARPRPRVGLTLDNLERNAQGHGLDDEYAVRAGDMDVTDSRILPAHLRNGSSGSDRSDPPYNVPREWGRKGRRDVNWLQRINATDDEVKKELKHAGEIRSEDVDWVRAAADAVLPTTENSPTASRRSRVNTPGSGDKRHNDSLDKIRELELELEESFAEASFVASTPAVASRRNRALDDIRQRELDILREESIIERQLEDVPQASPGERRSVPTSPSAGRRHGKERNLNHSTRPIEPTKSTRRSSSKAASPGTPPRKENAQPASDLDRGPTSPVVVYKSTKTVGIIDRGIQAEASASTSDRPGHRRQDSMGLLRQLARATSASPSPQNSFADISTVPITRNTERQSLSEKAANEQNETKSAAVAQTVATSVERMVVPAARRQSKPMDVRDTMGETASAPASAIPPLLNPEHAGLPDDIVDGAPIRNPETRARQKSIPNVPQTPVVTGAYPDTPGPGTARPRSSLFSRLPFGFRKRTSPTIPEEPAATKSKPEKEHLKPPKPSASANEVIAPPSHPRSALSAVINNAKRRASDPLEGPSNMGAQQALADALGDSTVESLEDILDPTNDGTDEPTLTLDLNLNDRVIDEELKRQPNSKGRPLSEAEKQRHAELLALRDMNNRLKAARVSIRDADRGMRRVERKVYSLGQQQLAGQIIQGKACAACGGTPTVIVLDPFQSLWEGVKNLFRTRYEDGTWKFTWFGLFTTLFLSWYITEETLCYYYCQPLYAYTMDGYGVDYNAPRYPWVTVTLFFRPWKWLWQPVLQFLGWAFGVLYHYIFADESHGPGSRPKVMSYGAAPTVPRRTVWGGEYGSARATAAAAKEWLPEYDDPF